MRALLFAIGAGAGALGPPVAAQGLEQGERVVEIAAGTEVRLALPHAADAPHVATLESYDFAGELVVLDAGGAELAHDADETMPSRAFVRVDGGAQLVVRALADGAGRCTVGLHARDGAGDRALRESEERWAASDYAGTVAAAERAAELARAGDDRRLLANALVMLGVSRGAIGDVAGSATAQAEAVRLFRGLGDRRREGMVVQNLANALQRQGRREEARDLRERGIAIARELGDRRSEASGLVNLGALLRDQDDLEGSRARLERALALLEEFDEPRFTLIARIQLGATCEALRDHAAALDHLEAAAARARALDAPAELANALASIARIRQVEGDLQAARDALEEALATAERVRHVPSQVWILGNLGNVYLDLGEYTRSREAFERRLELNAASGADPFVEGWSHWGVGRTLVMIGHASAAAEHVARALAIGEERGDRALVAAALELEGRVAAGRGDLDAARELLGRARSIHLERDDALRLADCTIALAELEVDRERGREGLAAARAAYERAGSTRGLLWSLGFEADLAWRAGDALGAAELARRQLALAEERGDRSVAAQAGHLLGVVEHALGDWPAALEATQRARDAARASGNRWAEVRSTRALARLWLSLGDARLSAELAARSVALAEEIEQPRETARGLYLVGLAQRRESEPGDAAATLERALALIVDLEAPVLRGRLLGALAALDHEAGRPEAGRAKLRRWIAIARERAEAAELAWALADLAASRLAAGERDAARPLVAEALATGGRVDGAVGMLYPLWVAANLALADDDLDRAEALLADARRALERPSVQELRSGVAATLRSRYAGWGRLEQDLVARRLSDAAPDARAALVEHGLVAAGRWKGRALLEGIVERRIGGRDAEVAQLVRAERAARVQRDATLDAAADAVAAGAPAAEVDRLRAQAAALRERADALAAEVAARSPRDARLEHPPRAGVADARALLPDTRSALVEYVEGTERLYAYLVTAGRLEHLDLGPLPDAQRTARAAVAAVADPASSVRAVVEAGRAAHERLLAPVLAALAEPPERLVVVPCASLARLPFEALVVAAPAHASDFERVEFVLDRHELTYGPALPVLAELADQGPRATAGRVLILADPLYPGERAEARPAEAAGGPRPALLGGPTRAPPAPTTLPRLPETREEAVALARLLARLAGGDAATELLDLEGRRSGSVRAALFDLHLGAAARPELLRGSLGEYSVLHLAAHGYVDAEDVQRSGLALSFVPGEPGWLTLAEVLDLRLDANLVVLSACETARGTVLAGEGVQSMARAFLHAGARGVVASLWPVADRATAETMKAFYRGTLEDGASPAAALARAKRAQRRSPGLRGVAAVAGAAGAGTVAAGHPWFWAPFVHVGLPR